MKRLIRLGTICVLTLMLTGCIFPSQRLYVVEDCDAIGCGKLALGAELGFLRETSGDNWRLWQKKPGNDFAKEVCIGTVSGSEFTCDACGPTGFFIISEADSSTCSYSHCMKFEHRGPNCPNEGSGRGGHN